MADHKIGTREERQAARAELLGREKELTRMGDELARHRRELPWVPVDKQYTLQTAEGPKTLVELFDHRSQLAIYHFMFGPSYQGGCPTCSSMADGFDALLPHLRARDVTMICVSSAPIESCSRFASGWAGASPGLPATAATSTPTWVLQQSRANARMGHPDARPAAAHRQPQCQ